MINSMYVNRIIFILALITLPILAKGQEDSVKYGVSYLRKALIDGDTLPHMNLKEVKIVPPWKFKSKRQHKRYSKLVISVKKTLPYARLAQHRMNEIALALDTIRGEKNRKVYVKKAEQELFKEFEQPLRKLTFSQGRMLIKLIDRETGETSYELIKELKGGFSAFMWQSIARLFGSNLKSEFDMEGDDAMVEHIILLIDNGML